jgi:hypothetical protein
MEIGFGIVPRWAMWVLLLHFLAEMRAIRYHAHPDSPGRRLPLCRG